MKHTSSNMGSDPNEKPMKNNYTPDRADISDNDWLAPGEKLNKNMIIMTAKGFQIRGSKWIFLRMKDMYIGIHDKGNNDFVAIAQLEKKNDNWIVFEYFLVNRYNSGRIYSRLIKKNKINSDGTIRSGPGSPGAVGVKP